MEQYKGYLYAKLSDIGTKSEGPRYYLQSLSKNDNAKDYEIHKVTEAWMTDPSLHQHLAEKVIVKGSLKKDVIYYESISRENP